MNLVAFDLEISKVLPEGEVDWQKERPLGISCAALQAIALVVYPRKNLDTGDFDDLVVTDGWTTQLDDKALRDFVNLLCLYADQGFIIVTVNGLGFDFQILAEESGMWQECADLALNHHCDLMLMSVCSKGWRTGLDSFAKGAGIKGKLKNVSLNSGVVLDSMDGAMAPKLWANGEYDAVLAYLKQDVAVTLGVAKTAVKDGVLRWVSSTGRLWGVSLPDGRLPTCREMLQWKRPDVGWMTDPPNPMEIAGWALEQIKNGGEG